MHGSVPCANGFWSRKFGLEIDEHIIMVNTISSNERNKATGSTVDKFCIIFIPQTYYCAR